MTTIPFHLTSGRSVCSNNGTPRQTGKRLGFVDRSSYSSCNRKWHGIILVGFYSGSWHSRDNHWMKSKVLTTTCAVLLTFNCCLLIWVSSSIYFQPRIMDCQFEPIAWTSRRLRRRWKGTPRPATTSSVDSDVSSSPGNGAGKKRARSSRQLPNVSAMIWILSGPHFSESCSCGWYETVLRPLSTSICLPIMCTIVFSPGKENVRPRKSRRINSEGHLVAWSHHRRYSRRYSKSRSYGGLVLGLVLNLVEGLVCCSLGKG